MTHAALLEQLARLDLTQAQALCLLADANVISDECLRLWDIAEPDLTAAVQWFKCKRVRYGTAYGGMDANEKVLV